MVKDRRAPENPLAFLSRVNEQVDRRRVRRAVSMFELASLIGAAKLGKPFRGISGEDRAVLYLLTPYTGFRAKEMASLAPLNFDLDSNPPTVTLAAGTSKHKRRDLLPLRDDITEFLKRWLQTRAPSKKIWPGMWFRKAAMMLRRDLRLTKTPYQNEAGLYFDFHALRHQYSTELYRSGVHPKVAQALMRHSDPSLTLNIYTHLNLSEQKRAVESLPAVCSSQHAGQHAGGMQELMAFRGTSCPLVTLSEALCGNKGRSRKPNNSKGKCVSMGELWGGAREGIRTPDLLIHSQAL